MANRDAAEDRDAKYGQKMIEVKVRFWTDHIAPTAGRVHPKHGWSSGVVRMDKNGSHGISGSKPVPFNSLLDVGSAIEQVLVENGIVLHPSRRMRKYVTDKPEF